MPFITEELYQRLPRPSSLPTIPSVCLAPYPEPTECRWRSETIEHEIELVQKIAKAIRSARSDYNIPNKTKTEAYLKSSDDKVLSRYISALETLSFCSAVRINETAPIGCAIITVSDKCEVNLLLKGLIDPAKELAKLQKKVDFLRSTRSKLNQAMTIADYATKVPAEVQNANEEKLTQTNMELERVEVAMEALKLFEKD